ncbi:flagellin [Ruminobacter amylophilus]|nr:flagellin [Ruminobacter amylophilus]
MNQNFSFTHKAGLTENAEMTRQNILQQVSTSILVNANQKNEIVLSLLQK